MKEYLTQVNARLEEVRQKANVAKYFIYKDLFDQLITQLTVAGYTPIASYIGRLGAARVANPIEQYEVGREIYSPEYYSVKFLIDTVEVSVTLDFNKSKLKATFKCWEPLSPSQIRRIKRWYAGGWEKHEYSYYKNSSTSKKAETLTELLKAVTKKLANSKKVEALRNEEVAAGHGKQLYF